MQKKEGGDFDSQLVDRVLTLYPPYDAQKKSRRVRPKQIRSWIRLLRQAESILMHVQPCLWLPEERIPAAMNVLKEAAHVLTTLGKAGRPPEINLGHCADFLASIFKRGTGSYHWEWVGEAMAKGFPDVLPPDDGRRDVALWAYNLAKRYRRRSANSTKLKIAHMRDGLEHLRKRLASPRPQTLADIYPSLLNTRGYLFWPDELPGHSPENCWICLERSKRGSRKRANSQEAGRR